MTDPDAAEPSLTELLLAAQQGDDAAGEAAARLVYRELRQLAAGYLARERPDHTLQPTALVHEAYLRLVRQDAPWTNRAHFFGIAAQMMRRILVDHARRQFAVRRDGGQRVDLDGAADLAPDGGDPEAAQRVLEVHEALAVLERMDARQARVVELKFFVGLTLEEIGEVLDISPATVSREWTLARRWLHLRLRER